MEKQIGTLLFTTKSGIDVYDCGDYFKFTLPPSDGTTGPEWIMRLEKKEFRFGEYTKSVLRSSDFKPTNGMTTEVVIFKGVLFKDNNRLTKNIRKTADDCSLATPNAEIACFIRELFTDEEIKSMGLIWIAIMHEPIKDSDGDPLFLCAARGDGGHWLDAYYGNPGSKWGSGGGFAFIVWSACTLEIW